MIGKLKGGDIFFPDDGCAKSFVMDLEPPEGELGRWPKCLAS